MPSSSDRLGLSIPTIADQFQTEDVADNWSLLDDYPGVFICSSTTRPSTWGANQDGMLIFEDDTRLLWSWNGGASAFERVSPTGWLGTDSRTTDLSTTATSYQVVVDQAVTVPDGGRRILVVCEAPGVYSTTAITGLAVFRGATQLQAWLHQGKTAGGSVAAEQPRPLFAGVVDAPGVAGAVTYSLQFRADPGFGGTVTIQAASDRKCAIHVSEM